MNFASPFFSAAAMGAQDFAERFERGLARAMQQLRPFEAQLGTDPWFFLIEGIWVWVNTYRYIFRGMNIHLPAILMFTRGTRF